MTLNAISRVTMRWTFAGKGKIGRPKLTWRRSVEKEMREVGWTWSLGDGLLYYRAQRGLSK